MCDEIRECELQSSSNENIGRSGVLRDALVQMYSAPGYQKCWLIVTSCAANQPTSQLTEDENL